MSGTNLDTDGIATPDGGCDNDQATQAQVIAAQVIDEAAESIVTHEGTVNNNFQFSFNGCTLDFLSFQQIIADAALYAAINASSLAAACVTWND